MHSKKLLKILSLTTAAAMTLSIAACSAKTDNSKPETNEETTEEITNSNDSEHAIEADGETISYSNIKVTKTGDSDEGDEADFYGDNSAIFATNGATLTLTDIVVDTDGMHANAVFSYGDGTTVNISDSEITTSGNCSGGLMTTGGGTMNATNLTIHTTGNSSAAIRSDRGGGTVNVDGGSYTTDGTGSPVIYSTADITVSNAYMESTASQGVVVEGKNSVTLNNVQMVADNNTKNSSNSDYYQAVMIYQSMSGDADVGLSEFTMNGGTITNANGDVFFVTNTATTISLENVSITNQDDSGVFLRASTAGWGSSGSNGGKVNLNLTDMDLTGDILVDSISAMNMYLKSETSYSGAINNSNEGQVYIEIESGSTWTLTGDSYVTSLTCDADAIDLNEYTLYVNGVAYEAGTASTGEALEIVNESSSGRGGAPDGMPSDGMPGEPPSGDRPSGERPSGERPSDGGSSGNPPSGERPSGNQGDPPQGGPGGDGNEPPARPEDD